MSLNSINEIKNNAKHHSFLKNFPFHKHEDADENVLDSVEMTLPDVLFFIKSHIE